MDRETKAVQLYDSSHQIEAKAHARRVSYLVGTIEPPQHRVALLFADARTGIRDADDRFVAATRQLDLHLAALRRKLDGVVDKVGDRLEQEIAVAAHAQPVSHLDPQIDILVLGDRLIDIADLAQHFMQWDGAEGRRPAAVL